MMRTLATLLLGIAIFLGNGCTTDFDRGYGAYQSGDYEQAASFFRLSAKQGNPIAQNNLAFMYPSGVDPYSHLKAVLERLTTAKHSHLDGLLPHNWNK